MNCKAFSVSRRLLLVVASVATVVSMLPNCAVAEEMIVTTRKTSENLQDVPIAVDVLSATQIDVRGINSTADVAKYVTSMQFDQGFAPQDTRIVIRGLSPTRGRQNVAVLLDGIDITSQSIQTNGGTLLINPRLFDAERVEIVKGPQNALYGRTAFAGAINYVSKQPTHELDGRIGVNVGNNGVWELKGNVSGPLVGETLTGIVTAATWNHDGFYKDTTTGAEVGTQEGYALSGGLRWNIGQFTISPRIDWTDDEFGSTPYAIQDPGELPPGVGRQPLPTTATTLQPGFTRPVLSAPFPPGAPYQPNPFLAPTAIVPAGDSVPVRLSQNPRSSTVYPGTEREIIRVALPIKVDLGAVDITWLNQYANLKTFQFEDANRNGDPTDDPATNPGKAGADGEFWADEERELITTDFRVSGDADLYSGGALGWSIGALYWQEDTTFDDGSITCLIQDPSVLAPGTNCGGVLAGFDNGAGSLARNPYRWEQESEHWSIYGLLDWQIVESFSAVFELRYSDEKQTISGPGSFTLSRIIDPSCDPALGSFFCFFPLPSVVNPQDPATDAVGKASDDFWSPKLTLQWEPAQNMMYYASVAQASKPAGIAPLNAGVGPFFPESQRFDREEMTAYEVGGKTSWLEDQLIFNVALFFQDYDDKQLSTQTIDPVSGLPATRVINAAAAEVLGLELETTWTPIEMLTLSLSYTYLDAEYTQLQPLSSSAANIAATGNCTVVDTPGTPVGTAPTCQLNQSGNKLEDAPEHALTAFGRVGTPLTATMGWFLEADAIYQDERYESATNAVKFDSYALFNFRLGLETDVWDVIAYVDNAFEDDTFKTGFQNPDARFIASGFPYNGSYIKPDLRQWGVRANWRFGKN